MRPLPSCFETVRSVRAAFPSRHPYFTMNSFFQPCPAELTSAQRQHWDRRRQTAERLLDQHAAAPAPDAETLTHLQHYVRGEITLGQLIGRLLDAQARHQVQR